MSLRCVYTDLDGTLYGKQGSLFRDAEGNFTMLQARALEACHRAGVEVVIMSGRREAQVLADARVIGQSSYIYEAGCGVTIDLERTLLIGEWAPGDGDDPTPAQRMLDAGIPDLLFDRFGDQLEWHRPWHTDRHLSHLIRGSVDVAEANALLAREGHEDVRFLDNGAIAERMEAVEGPAHAYHLVPGGASKAKAVAFHMRARGYDPESCIAVGDSLEDLDAAQAVGRFFVVANGPERDDALREALPGFPNATVTEGRWATGSTRPWSRPWPSGASSIPPRGRRRPPHARDQAVGEPGREPVQPEQPHLARRVHLAAVGLDRGDDVSGDLGGGNRVLVAAPVGQPLALVVVKGRLHLAGEHGGDADAAPGELVAKRLGEAAPEGLRAAVDRTPRKCSNPRPRGDDHHVPAGRVHHRPRPASTVWRVPRTLMRTISSAFSTLDVGERPVVGDARIGHEQVEAAGPL